MPAALRVSILGPTYPFRGGIAHHTTLLAAALRERHAVQLVTFRRQYPRRLFPGRTDRDPSPPPPDLQAPRLLEPLLPWSWWRVAGRIAAFRPDVLVVPWWVPFWGPSVGVVARLVRRRGRTRVVFLCHNVMPHEGTGIVTRALTGFALRAADAFIVHSATDEAALRRLVPRAAARPGAVRRALLPAHSIAAPVGRAEARSRLGLPPDARVALFFGFVRPYKGLEHLIDAVALAMPRVPDLVLVVAGEFWQPPGRFLERARLAGIADRVRLDDRYVPNDEVGAYFCAADVVVLPYVEATQSGVVTLAAEFSVPVVVTRVGGLPEAVLDGRTGLVVPPGDAAALADALATALGDSPAADALRRGTAEGRSRFDWAPLVRLVEDLAADGRRGAEGP